MAEQRALSELTTVRLGGPAAEYVEATDEAALIEAVDSADRAGLPVLVVGGGSNLVVADAGFPGRVVAVRNTGLSAEVDACSGATVEVGAGMVWDDFVVHAVGQGWTGVAALSGIPGSVGATPMQNVGAYGREIAQVVARVRTWDRQERAVRTFAAADCGFGYRTSRFKAEADRHLILSVTLQLPVGELDAPVAYAELARSLGLEIGGRAPSARLREVVLGLRRGKGMVLDDDDHDTWSTGSFFTNPVLAPQDLPEGAPAWEQPDGRVKTSAAWLIERAGFAKGYGNDRVRLSGKHTLALTNRGGGSTAELLELAREVRDGVAERFGVRLVNEPVLVGCSLG